MNHKHITVVVFFLLLTTITINNLKKIPLNSDEISWFFHSRFFKTLVLDHNISESVWNTHEGLDHPPISKYLFGAYLYIYDKNTFAEMDRLERTYGRWQFFTDVRLTDIKKSEFSNYIYRMREINIFFIIGSFALLSVIVWYVCNSWIVGLFVSLSLAINPLFNTSMIRATSDACMVFFSLLSLVIIMRSKSLRALVWGAVAAGVSLSSKLTGLFSCITLVSYEMFAPFYSKKTLLHRIFIVPVIVLFVWIISNPLTYTAPFRGSKDMFIYRRDESYQIQKDIPSVALKTIKERIIATYCEVFDSQCGKYNSALTGSVTINISTLLLGIFAMLNVKRASRRSTLLFFLYFLILTSLNTMILPLYSDRYFLLPIILVQVISFVGVFAFVTSLFDICKKHKSIKNRNIESVID